MPNPMPGPMPVKPKQGHSVLMPIALIAFALVAFMFFILWSMDYFANGTVIDKSSKTNTNKKATHTTRVVNTNRNTNSATNTPTGTQ